MQKALLAIVASLAFISAALPRTGPIPQPRPERNASPAQPASPPEAPPVPTEKSDTKPEADPAPSGKDEEAASQPPEDPVAFAACMKALEESGAIFRVIDEKEGPGACGIDRPVELSEPAPGLHLSPPAVLRCDAALATVHWSKEMLLPAASRAFPEKRLEKLTNASSYICRNRNNAESGKVSEHAKGNALDLSAVTFKDGFSLIMKPRNEDSDMAGAFQRGIAASACLYFTTVLSPGSDAAHQDHLHLDVLQRRNGYRYCR